MLRAVLTVSLLLAAGPLLASSFAGTSAGSASDASSEGSSASSGSSSGDDKVVLAAREEAAGFVASNGPKALPALPPTWKVDCARP